MLRDRPADLPRQPVVADAPQAGPADSKISDRVAGERAPGAAPPAPAAPGAAAPRGDVAVAQRAMLTRRTRPIRRPRRSRRRAPCGGSTTSTPGKARRSRPWCGRPSSAGRQALPEPLLRRNPDQTLPASHTVELAFTTPPGRSGACRPATSACCSSRTTRRRAARRCRDCRCRCRKTCS